MLHRRLETGTWNLLGEPSGRGKGVIYIYKALCESVSESVSNVLFVPRGTNIFHTQVRGGGQTFYVEDVGGDDDVDGEEEDVSDESRFGICKCY